MQTNVKEELSFISCSTFKDTKSFWTYSSETVMKNVFGVSPWQESWYEFRVMAVMDDLISESSNVVGVSSTGVFL